MTWDPLGFMGGGFQWDQILLGPLALLGGDDDETQSGGELAIPTVTGSISSSISGFIQIILPLVLLAVVVWLVLKYGKRLLK